MAKVMFCFSTQNQTVNLIPALQEKVDKIVMFSTKKAKMDGWTENFKSIIDARNSDNKPRRIECEYWNISEYEEEIIELVDKITEEVRQHDSLKDFDCLKDFADKVNRIIENKEALRNVGKLANDIIEKAKKHTDLDEFKSVKKLAEEINAKIKEKEVLKINELRDKILEVVNRYAVDQNEIQLNIGGGQKIHTLALIEAWKKCEYENTKLVYSEANERTLYSITKDSMLTTKQTTSGYEVDLSLEEILRSYGYEFTKEEDDKVNWRITKEVDGVLKITDELMKDDYSAADKHNEYLKNDRLYQEIFYQIMMGDEMEEPISYEELVYGDKFKNIVDRYKPSANPTKYTWTNGVLKKLKSISVSAEKIKKMMNSEEVLAEEIESETNKIQENAKNVISPDRISENLKMYCNDLADALKKKFKKRQTVLINRSFGENEKGKIKCMFRGSVFDEDGCLRQCFFPDKNGAFFEKMVTSEVCKLKDDVDAWKSIHEIWLNVKTKQISSQKNENDAEYDVVIVTKFGTLILLEAKSAKFDNKIAKGQERDVFQKSGPYGRATIVGPLLKEMLKASEKERKEKYPFVTKTFYDQTEKVESAGMTYWCFDEIVEKLKNLLKNK